MGSSLKKQAGAANKAGIAIFGVGAILSFIFVHWFLGVVLIAGAVYCFWGLMKDYARSGKRF